MTFICAEIGVNWRNLNEADEMIREAAAAGANACKFQAYEKFERWEVNPPQPGIVFSMTEINPLADQLNAIRLNETAVRYLYWRCRAAGVEFMCTPMYPEAVAMLDPYVKRWKVRYKDRMNHDILQKCIDTGKEILCSEQSPKVNDQIKSLYCCPEYPPAIEPEIFAYGNTPAMLQEAGFVGYSCHIPDWTHAASAVTHNGLKYLEVHVKRDHYPDNYCPIDNAVSITMSELAKLCRRLNP